MFANRLNGVSESVALKLNALAKKMQAAGEPVCNFTVGEPDFPVDESVKAAVVQALQANRSKYTPVAGIPELRALVAAYTNRWQPSLVAQRGPWTADDVVVSNGVKQGLFNSCFALLNPGDEVIVPVPYWGSYTEIVKLCEGVERLVPTRAADGFKLKPADLEKALNAKSRILMINTPNNPTGAVYTRAELAALGEVLLKHPAGKRVWVISDEIYDRIVYNPSQYCSFLEAVPALRDRVVTLNGLSKSAAMPGWRVGWSVTPRELADAFVTVQGQSTSGINALAQWASIAALNLPETYFEKNLAIYARRRQIVVDILSKCSKLELAPADGAFYGFFGVKKALKPGTDSAAFASALLQEAKVAVMPGTAFGEPDWCRLSFATDEKTIQDGCERIVRFAETWAK